MRKLLFLPVLVLTLAAASPTAASGPSASTITVRITSKGFDPASVSIQNGDVVLWTNTDRAAHQVVGDDGSFRSDVLQPGATYSHAFSSAGTFGYHGGINTAFRGTVNVALSRFVLMFQSKRITTYVHGVRLSGTISSTSSGEDVVIESRPRGTDSFEEVARTSSFSGNWRLTVRPTRTTEYRAVWSNVYSNVHTISVRPFLRLKQTGRGHFWAYAHADGVRYGRVTLQRWIRHRGWRSLRTLRLTRLRTGPNQEWISFRRFNLRFRRGTILRLRMSRAQAGPVMYGPALSKPIRV
jgi:plastocyanin